MVDADRVVADSQVFVAERRENGSWVRVVTIARDSVRAVERRVSRPEGQSWMVEDVRPVAGLATAAQALRDTGSPAGRRRRLRPVPTAIEGETR
jgi:hypothetical protein